MQHSNRPYLELDSARRALAAMGQATTLAAVEEHWKEYLGRLERVWNKSLSHFGKSPKWSGWQGPFLKLRKHDPLLSYFINARGADEHTIGDITVSEPGALTINAGPSGRCHIQSLTIRDGVVSFKADPEAIVTVVAPSVKLLPITNRNVLYDVPLNHLSLPIDPNDLIDIAEKGIAFYAKFLEQAEAFFVKAG